ncbi:hypothetical protein ACFCW6_25620 [Streptomyces sp. NPDC056333]|uniref:hypothetical protein n=1 Tax=Streptomyces sp. NPDC056333 TaxID=3345786 RepID=UPI0035D8E4E7
MAGVWVTVRLPTEAAGEIDGALAEALAPFFLDTDHNPVDRRMCAPGEIVLNSSEIAHGWAP